MLVEKAALLTTVKLLEILELVRSAEVMYGRKRSIELLSIKLFSLKTEGGRLVNKIYWKVFT